MKAILAVLGLLMLNGNISAQSDSISKRMCDLYMKNPYVFEGKALSYKSVRVETDSGYSKIEKARGISYANYNIYLVEVDRVIKGDIHKGTIEIIQGTYGIFFKGKDFTEELGAPSDGNDDLPSHAIYCVYDVTPRAMDSTALLIPNTNSKMVQCYLGLVIPISNGRSGAVVGGYQSSTLSAFYEYLNKNYALHIDTTATR